MSRMTLYHTGYQEIRFPDIHYGRRNADFGQGFYLSDNQEFSERWAREQAGSQTIINQYELDMEGLSVRIFQRDAEWYGYIDSNRHMKPDLLEEDVIIGPIANDTLFNTMGIITSGILKKEESLLLLQIGPEYRQITIKTEKAVSRLRWISARIMDKTELERNRRLLKAEEDAYQRRFAEKMQEIDETEEALSY